MEKSTIDERVTVDGRFETLHPLPACVADETSERPPSSELDKDEFFHNLRTVRQGAVGGPSDMQRAFAPISRQCSLLQVLRNFPGFRTSDTS